MDKVNNAILQTLAYSDIFSYPLTKEELWQYLIWENRKPPFFYTQFQTVIENLVKKKLIFSDGTYYCIKGRKEILPKRKQKKSINEKKMLLAKKISKLLSYFSTVLFIGVSGSLAMDNSELQDDIDLFIITEKQTLWITRLCILIVLQILGKRRKREEIDTKDKICINMLLDTRALAFPKNLQDIYTAHEIMQIKPLVSKNDVHNKFIRANTWVSKFLPNAFAGKVVQKAVKEKNFQKNKKVFLFQVFESLARMFQLWKIQQHMTIETVTNTKLAFHPYDYRIEVLQKWEKIQKRYEIL